MKITMIGVEGVDLQRVPPVAITSPSATLACSQIKKASNTKVSNGLQRASNNIAIYRIQKTIKRAMRSMSSYDPYMRFISIKFGPRRKMTAQFVGPVALEGRDELKELIPGLFGTNESERQLYLERLKLVLSGGVVSKDTELLLRESMAEGIIDKDQYDKMMSLGHQTKRSAPSPPLPSPPAATQAVVHPAVDVPPLLHINEAFPSSLPPAGPSARVTMGRSNGNITADLENRWRGEVQKAMDSMDKETMLKVYRQKDDKLTLYKSERQTAKVRDIYIPLHNALAKMN